jgi:hypothetical protein
MIRLAALALPLLLALPAAAQHIGPCDPEITSAVNVDWSDPTRTFANDRVRLTALDTGEPEDAAFHVMVTLPEPEAPGAGCHLISADAELTGYGSLSLRRASSRYDGAALAIGVPGTLPDGTPLLIEFSVNQSAGEVAAR